MRALISIVLVVAGCHSALADWSTAESESRATKLTCKGMGRVSGRAKRTLLAWEGINLELKLSFRRGALRNSLRVYCGGAAVVCARSLTRAASACCRAGMFGAGLESLLRYAFPLFPTPAYNLRRFGTPGLNGLRNPRELRLAEARSDDRQLLREADIRNWQQGQICSTVPIAEVVIKLGGHRRS
jgi:hypothetical protein